MFTQSMPALAQALQGALPEQAIRQLMQSLGNCAQPLTHRGPISVQPGFRTGVGGLVRPNTWNPGNYRDLLPPAGSNVFVDVAGNTYGGDSYGDNTYNVSNDPSYYNNEFSFPTDLAFSYNEYYGGPTFNVAGDSYFDNSQIRNLKTDNIITNQITIGGNTYVQQGDTTNIINNNGGGGDGNGGGNGGGNGNTILVNFNPAVRTTTYLRSVKARGTAPVPAEFALQDGKVTLTPATKNVTVTVNGEVTIPTVESAYADISGLSGKATVPTISSISLTSATASGNVEYQTYPTAKCSSLSGTVSVPSSGTFSGDVQGIKISGSIGSLTGTVSVPVITGGYLDSNCKLQLTSSTQQMTVSLSGSPSVTVDSAGSVSGSVSLSSQPATVSIGTPTIQLEQSSKTASVSLTVTGGVTFTSGSTDASVTISNGTADVHLKAGSQNQSVESKGTVEIKQCPDEAKVDNLTVKSKGTTDAKLSLNVSGSTDFLIYYRPRF